MKRPVVPARIPTRPMRNRVGYTLIEILVATALTLLMMGAVVTIFAQIGSSVNESRSTLELSDRLRSTSTRLLSDLEGLTVTMRPPRRPEANEGYFELIEGPMGPDPNAQPEPKNSDAGAVDAAGNPLDDSTVGDVDDILMFTTHSLGRPFVGRCIGKPDKTIKSDLAEIAWFCRGRTLYRRVLLVAPAVNLSNVSPNGFYGGYDISVRNVGGVLFPNTLGDLTKREYRFAHDPSNFPFDIRNWGHLRLPTLRECSSPAWVVGKEPIWKSSPSVDFWSQKPCDWSPVETITGTLAGYNGTRVAEDIILTNVIGFDVKVWDPGAASGMGMYVDLGGPEAVTFLGNGFAASKLNIKPPDQPDDEFARVYCTWSFHYEHDGFNQDNGLPTDLGTDTGTDGLDDNNGFGVDDIFERDTSPPYPVSLRGIQVKIRAYEPDSRQIREVTIVQDFLPK